jgi:hypothetical protein
MGHSRQGHPGCYRTLSSVPSPHPPLGSYQNSLWALPNVTSRTRSPWTKLLAPT